MVKTYKKRTRLKNFNYRGSYRYFITICTRKKRPVFTENSLVAWLIDILRDTASSRGFKVWAYCFMPDHLHLLLEGLRDNADLKKFITLFKQKTGYRFKNEFKFPLWQINYFERVLRKEEDTASVANYIFNNPVRKKMTLHFKDYPFSGSFELDFLNL